MDLNQDQETTPAPMDEEELQELLQVGEEASTSDYTKEWATLDELDKLMRQLDGEEKLTDICSYESISSAELETGNLTSLLHESRPVPSCVEKADDHPVFPYRGPTIQTGHGEPRRDFPSADERLEPAEGGPEPAPEEDTVVEPVPIPPGQLTHRKLR